MDSRLFEIDPMAGISYAKYNSIKGDDGSFLDFLLQYDSYEANNDDDSWFSDLLKDKTKNLINQPQLLQAFDAYDISTLDYLSSKSYFDTQVEAYKTELLKQMQKRGISAPTFVDMPLLD